MIQNRRLCRRTVLRGAGAALALPWLEAMAGPASGANDIVHKHPIRTGFLFFPNGVRKDRWTPEKEGASWKPSAQLEPLGDRCKDISVLSGLWNQASKPGDGHYCKDAAWLTGTTIRKTTGVNLSSGGVSADQLIANAIGNHTPLPSMQLGIEPVQVGVDRNVGYTRVYGAHVSWRTPNQPLSKEINPRHVFDRMTRLASGKQNSQSTRPLLDLVGESTRSLQRTLGSNDRHRLGEYLESVRSLEQRLERLEDDSQNTWKPLVDFSKRSPPTEKPEDHSERVKLMLDMLVLAFEADITRVSTFMFGNAVSQINFSFLDGVSGAHHQISHHQNKIDKIEQYERITRWHVEQFAYFIDRLESIQEGETTLLDNSMLLFGSALRDGNTHDPHDLPLLLAGKAGGKLRTGQHIRSTKDSPMANLLLTMMNTVGLPDKSFADSDGPIESLFA